MRGHQAGVPRYEGFQGMRGLKVQQQKSSPSWWLGWFATEVVGKAERTKNKKRVSPTSRPCRKQLVKTFCNFCNSLKEFLLMITRETFIFAENDVAVCRVTRTLNSIRFLKGKRKIIVV